MKKKLLMILLVVVSSFLGGMVSSLILIPTLAHADYSYLYAAKLQIENKLGKVTGDIFTPLEGGGAILDLYDENTTLRLQAGTYSSGGEKGLPFLGLSDNSAKLRMLSRLAGKNESPVLIFKDKAGRDRMVMGLSLSDGNEEPFLTVIDADGKKKNVFGNY